MIRSNPWWLYAAVSTVAGVTFAAVFGSVWMTVFPNVVRSLLAVWP